MTGHTGVIALIRGVSAHPQHVSVFHRSRYINSQRLIVEPQNRETSNSSISSGAKAKKNGTPEGSLPRGYLILDFPLSYIVYLFDKLLIKNRVSSATRVHLTICATLKNRLLVALLQWSP
jgi:hypothetical protein